MSQAALRQRLAAILAADAAGYSRLMRLDERATVTSLDAARGVFQRVTRENTGRIVDTAGDSVLAVFDTAGGAVSAALEIQRALGEAVAALPGDRRLRFRIGELGLRVRALASEALRDVDRERCELAIRKARAVLAVDPHNVMAPEALGAHADRTTPCAASPFA